ncbi:EamA family transporter [Azoarcus indigens]|uniref:Threonine/homoserine efflux transporter RhtA n=1 Tax=Azoarcus indigens TaxID=29545 RepID=A0A4R6E254_9RHOO|nr:DMT family transporter [Azoarcus indigens]NMG66182.1 EamA family transporter [Azoarcus indigens]TDN51354.1 threonine/homoserine efflux transporter RhtA [Azoarcus indigens]
MRKSTLLQLVAVAMIAFAGNSLLCRIALREGHIDAASFSTLRLASGALMLWLLVRRREGSGAGHGSWISAFALFAYAAGFSFAYLTLPAAAGALLLFGAVQATMIGYGLWRGERLNLLQGGGLLLAAGGLVGLLLPGLSAPPLRGALLMIAAGIAWGVYSLRGRGVARATASTAGNFLRALPFAAVLSLLTLQQAALTPAGIGYAIASGALASGLGYAIWYSVLPALRATNAATIQLSVPVITAAGGVIFLGEPITLRLVLTSIAILAGIALVITGKRAAG